MYGSCKCKNIEVRWRVLDLSMIPRACQCTYCKSKGAAYVSKAGSRVEVVINNVSQHKIVQHGSRSAEFHECTNCGSVVLVTSNIEGVKYGVLNANCMSNEKGFQTPIETNFSSQSAIEKQERWRENWCCPVLISSDSSGLR